MTISQLRVLLLPNRYLAMPRGIFNTTGSRLLLESVDNGQRMMLNILQCTVQTLTTRIILSKISTAPRVRNHNLDYVNNSLTLSLLQEFPISKLEIVDICVCLGTHDTWAEVPKPIESGKNTQHLLSSSYLQSCQGEMLIGLLKI